MRRINNIIISGAVAICLGATSCFTGVESTPKITAHDVKREKITERPEDTFLSDIDRQPFSEWTPGKKFYVTDNKIALMLGSSGSEAGNLAGDTITLKSISPATSVTGEDVTDITFSTPGGNDVTYRAGYSPSQLAQLPGLEIPFAIEESMVQRTSQRLKGQKYYIITSSWYDTEGKARSGRRFVPVTVTDVTFGNSFYPVKLIMADENGNPFSLFLSIGKNLKAPRKFANLFSFKDPRTNYPLISDDNWKLIINGRVALDMTRDEARLALGMPANIDRRPGYSFMREIWTYENGIFLIFEDGLLKSFRQ